MLRVVSFVIIPQIFVIIATNDCIASLPVVSTSAAGDSICEHSVGGKDATSKKLSIADLSHQSRSLVQNPHPMARNIVLLQMASTVKPRTSRQSMPRKTTNQNATSSYDLLQPVPAEHHSRMSQGEFSFLEERQQMMQAPVSMRNQFHFDTVSVPMFCVMWLTIGLLMAYTMLSLLRNSAELAEVSRPMIITEGLTVAVRSNSHAAALGTLFVAFRIFLMVSTNGNGEPEACMKALMIVATAGVTLQIVLGITLPFIMTMEKTNKSISELTGESTDCHPKMPKDAFKTKYWWMCACFVQACAMICIYGGAFGIFAGAFILWHAMVAPSRMPSAIMCVFLLNAIFLLNQLHLFGKRCVSGLIGGVRIASLRARKAPMIAVLFLAAQMQDIQLNASNGSQSPWARLSFYVVVVGITSEIACSVLAGTPALSHGEEAIIKEVYHPKQTHPWMRRLQQFSALIVFEGLFLVCFAIFLAGAGSSLSSTMSCVLLLSFLFFLVHIFQFLASFATQLNKWGEIMQSTALSAGVCVSLCPMLSILFVACRMRALELTLQQGSPQWWTENAMELCTFAIFIQVFCCMALPAFTGAATVVDHDGNAKLELPPMMVAYAVQGIKYIALLCLYVGLLTVCLGIFRMHKGMNDGSNSYHKELLSKIAIAIGIVFAASLLSSAKVMGLVVKWAIESMDETSLGVEIKVGKAALSFLHGYFFMTDLVVKNPTLPRFTSRELLKVDKVLIKIRIWRMLCSCFSKVEISTLRITGVAVNYEMDIFRNSNVQTVAKLMSGPKDSMQHEERKSCKAWCQGLSGSEKDIQPPRKDQPHWLLFEGLLHIEDICTSVWNMQMGKLMTVSLGDVRSDDLQEHFGGDVFGVVRGMIQMVMKTVLNTVLENARRLAKYAPSSCCSCHGHLAMCSLCR